MRSFSFKTILLMGGVCLTACSLAPDYTPPTAPAPATYKEDKGWTETGPADNVDRGSWWTVFHDPELDKLEAQVAVANQNLKIALSQYDQAKALAHIAQAAYYPTVTGGISGTRNRLSGTAANTGTDRIYSDYTLGADLSYEVDLWGRVRNTVEANEDQAEASAADVESIKLSLEAELANDYFTLRGDDVAGEILDKTVAAYQKAYDLTLRRYHGGISPEIDVDQAETALENAKTQDADIHLQRAQLEHAIAILIGKSPAGFSLTPVSSVTARIPILKPGLPATVLTRRPDVAAAERRVAAANAEIGVARAAWFPTISLTGNFGFEGSRSGSWLTAPSEFWSLGPSAAMTILNFGAISGLNAEARAAYQQTVASYRQSVLTAFQEVEDNLAALHHLSDEAKSQKQASAAAARALIQANDRYQDGVATYLDVVSSETADLQSKIADINIETRRLVASIQLIKALGGGWSHETTVHVSKKHMR